VPVPTNS